MNIPRLVLKNSVGRKGRFSFTLLGITIGVASFVTLLCLGGGLKREVTQQASQLGANMVVTPKGWCAYEQISVLTGEQLPEAISLDQVKKIAALKGISAVPYLTEKTAYQNNPIPVVGILPAEMKTFKGWDVESGTYFSDQNEKAVLIGSSIAQQFRLRPEDEMTIRGKKLPVKGILKGTGSRDDISVFVPLSVAQKLYGAGDNVSYIAVKVDDIAKTSQYIQSIQDASNLAVVSDTQLLRSVLSIVGTVGITLQLIAAVAIIAAGFGIINTMMTAIHERKREIGILQAIGAKRLTVFNMFLLESGLYGLLGGILGVAVGLAFSSVAGPYISQNEFTAFLKGSTLPINISVRLVLGSIAFSLAVALVSGFYPAWRASRLSPVEAMHYE